MLFFYVMILPMATIAPFFLARARGSLAARVVCNVIGGLAGAYAVTLTLVGVTRSWNHPMMMDDGGYGRIIGLAVVLVYAGMLAHLATDKS